MVRKKNVDPFSRWDTVLERLAFYCLITLVAVQALLFFESPRRYLSMLERIEGRPLDWQTTLIAETPPVISGEKPAVNPLAILRESRKLAIRSVRPAVHPDIIVTINGVPAGNFRQGEVQLTVYNGDYIEIDASRARGDGRFVVSVPGDGLSSPADGAVVEGQGGLLPVGKVKFRP